MDWSRFKSIAYVLGFLLIVFLILMEMFFYPARYQKMYKDFMSQRGIEREIIVYSGGKVVEKLVGDFYIERKGGALYILDTKKNISYMVSGTVVIKEKK